MEKAFKIRGNRNVEDFEESLSATTNDFSLFKAGYENKEESDLLLNSFLEEDALNLSHIGSRLPIKESICGNTDERTTVSSITYPYKMVCRLIIRDKNGIYRDGTGFFISPRCIITSGHCVHVYTGGGKCDWVESIIVAPGSNKRSAPFGYQESTKFRSVDGWINSRDPNFDYGAIILPDNTLFNSVGGYWGYQKITTPVPIFTLGYPSDKPENQWLSQGDIEYFSKYKLEYMLDTEGGNSGGPVFYINEDNIPIVVGVHCYGGCPNSCVRLQDYMFPIWAKWSQL